MEGIWTIVVMFILLITVIPSSSMSVKLHQFPLPSKPVVPTKQQVVTVYAVGNESSLIHRVRREPEPAVHLFKISITAIDTIICRQK